MSNVTLAYAIQVAWINSDQIHAADLLHDQSGVLELNGHITIS